MKTRAWGRIGTSGKAQDPAFPAYPKPQEGSHHGPPMKARSYKGRSPRFSSEIGRARLVRLRAIGLELCFPLVVGHAVDDSSSLVLAERDVSLIGRF